MDIMSLDRLAQEIGGQLPLIKGMGGSLVKPIGFVLMNVKVPCVRGYDEDQVALVMDDPEAAVEDEGPSGPLPSLLTQQEGDMTSWVWMNGEFRTKAWTQMMSRAPESPPDQPGDEVSDLESGMLDSESEGM